MEQVDRSPNPARLTVWLSVASLLILTIPTHAQKGASAAPIASGVEVGPAAAAITAFKSFSSAGYATAGVGLRNQARGGMVVSGAIIPVQAAYLYWAVITTGAPGTADQGIIVQRLFPTPASSAVNLTGTVLGTGSTPCWGGDR